MRALLILLALVTGLGAARGADAVTGRVVKVLPFLVDRQGRIARSPSLFDRDAYQAFLQEHRTNITTMRFDVLWKATKAPEEKLRLAVELRTLGTNAVPQVTTLETNVVPERFGTWTTVPLSVAQYQSMGHVVAWHVTLWNGDERLGEQKSFLW